MTSPRAQAYGRVMHTLRNMGAAKLLPVERACIREAADALLFSRDLDDQDARLALAGVRILVDDLVNADRCTPRRARKLLDDIWGCGSAAVVDLPAVA